MTHILKQHFYVTMIVFLLCGSATLYADATTSPVVDSSLQADSEVVAPITTDTQLGHGDPFNYRTDDLTSYNPDEKPIALPHIKIKAVIITPKNSFATIEVGTNTMHIKEGDVIRLPSTSPVASHLKVMRIAEHQIDFAPQEQPEKLIIIK